MVKIALIHGHQAPAIECQYPKPGHDTNDRLEKIATLIQDRLREMAGQRQNSNLDPEYRWQPHIPPSSWNLKFCYMELTTNLLPWLLQQDNPAVRFLALRDLLNRPVSGPEVAQARAAIMDYPPVRSILDRFSVPGYWEQLDDEHVRRHVVWVLLLAGLGAVPGDPLVCRACELTLETMQRSDGAFPSRHPVYGGVRPCTQGLVTEALLWLTPDCDPRLERAGDFAASMTYECGYNGGLPCAWGVVKLLRSMAAVPACQRSPNVLTATQRGVSFLSMYDLAQADFPYAEAVSPEWFRFGFPRGYQSDVLETLETLARLGWSPNPRFEPAVGLVLSKQRADGRWHSEFVSPMARELGVDREGAPSKWITLRALRVLRWWVSSRLPDGGQ